MMGESEDTTTEVRMQTAERIQDYDRRENRENVGGSSPADTDLSCLFS